MSEEGEKGVDSRGTWVLEDCGKQRQEGLREFEASQDYTVRLCLKTKQTPTHS